MNNDKNLPSIRRANELDIKFPTNSNLKEDEQRRIQNSINKGGIAINQSTFISEKQIPQLLGTDKKGAMKIVNDAPDDDIKSIDNDKYVSSPEMIKQIAIRKEEPRSQLEREKLGYAIDCIRALSDSQTLQIERSIGSDRIEKERPKLTNQILKQRNTTCSEFSGKPFDNTPGGKPVAHHKNRVSDKPNQALNPDNLALMRTDEHIDFHNSNYIPDENGYEQAKKRNNNNE